MTAVVPTRGLDQVTGRGVSTGRAAKRSFLLAPPVRIEQRVSICRIAARLGAIAECNTILIDEVTYNRIEK